MAVWLVNPRDTAEVAYRFVDEARSGLPVLLDTDSRFYNSYPRPTAYGPFPFHVLIDREGVIRKKWIGAEDWNSDGNKRLLEQLLAQPRS